MGFITGRKKDMGKIEFLANRPRILKMMQEGYSPIMMFEELKGKGEITIGYKQFCRYVAAMRAEPTSSSLVLPPAFVPYEAPVPAMPALPPGETPPTPRKRGRPRKTPTAEASEQAKLILSIDAGNFDPTNFSTL